MKQAFRVVVLLVSMASMFLCGAAHREAQYGAELRALEQRFKDLSSGLDRSRGALEHSARQLVDVTHVLNECEETLTTCRKEVAAWRGAICAWDEPTRVVR